MRRRKNKFIILGEQHSASQDLSRRTGQLTAYLRIASGSNTCAASDVFLVEPGPLFRVLLPARAGRRGSLLQQRHLSESESRPAPAQSPF